MWKLYVLQMSVGLSQVLLEPSCTHPAAYLPYLLLSYSGRVEGLWQRPHGPQSLDYLLSGPWQEQVADPCRTQCCEQSRLQGEIHSVGWRLKAGRDVGRLSTVEGEAPPREGVLEKGQGLDQRRVSDPPCWDVKVLACVLSEDKECLHPQWTFGPGYGTCHLHLSDGPKHKHRMALLLQS